MVSNLDYAEEALIELQSYLNKEIEHAQREADRADCHGPDHEYGEWLAVVAALVKVRRKVDDFLDY